MAGGRSRRFGGVDKALALVNGVPLYQLAALAIEPGVGRVLINSNSEDCLKRISEYEVIPDESGDYAGPLAGMLAGCRASRTPYVLFVPCDAPFIVPDLATRLYRALEVGSATVACARTSDGLHPVFALMKSSCLTSLEEALAERRHAARDWMKAQQAVYVDFDDCVDGFTNINTPEQLARLGGRPAG